MLKPILNLNSAMNHITLIKAQEIHWFVWKKTLLKWTRKQMQLADRSQVIRSTAANLRSGLAAEIMFHSFFLPEPRAHLPPRHPQNLTQL